MLEREFEMVFKKRELVRACGIVNKKDTLEVRLERFSRLYTNIYTGKLPQSTYVPI